MHTKFVRPELWWKCYSH